MSAWTEITQADDYGQRFAREIPEVGRVWVNEYPATLERAAFWQAYHQSPTGSKRIGTIYGFTSSKAAMAAADAWAHVEVVKA